MNGKRPSEFDDEDTDSKRVHSNNGSPAPAGRGANAGQDAQSRMAAIRAKLAAKKTDTTTPNGGQPPRSPAPAVGPPEPRGNSSNASAANGNLEAKKAADLQRIAELKASLASRKPGQPPLPVASSNVPPAPPAAAVRDQRAAGIAESIARARAIAKRLPTSSGKTTTDNTPPIRREEDRSSKSGLGIGLHPALLDNSSGLGLKAKGSQGAHLQANKGGRERYGVTDNPYLSAADSKPKAAQNDAFDPTLVTRKGGERKSKQLVFNQKGKFMAQADALRHQAQMEEMKRRLAEEARKAEIEQASDKSYLVAKPADVAWWDENIVGKIDTSDSIITTLVQHPVILQAPQDKFQPAPKPLMLTPKEQKKLRRQRRMADMKEEQAKIRLGLIEPPPPKVKKSNMMRVLGEQAVKDPTAVEARVNREIAQRAADHEQANADRQLTKEQRAEKLKRQQEGDEAKGIHVAIFRVDNLSSGKHRYQVDVNAKQTALTGIVILHPEMNLVIVEGGARAISMYKKLMLNRIKWSENTMPLSTAAGPSTFTGGNDGTKASGGEQSKASQWLNPLDDHGDLKDLSDNRCVLVWEGEEAQRSFKRWGSKACETDGEARDVLTRSKMENMWTLARGTDPHAA